MDQIPQAAQLAQLAAAGEAVQHAHAGQHLLPGFLNLQPAAGGIAAVVAAAEALDSLIQNLPLDMEPSLLGVVAGDVEVVEAQVPLRKPRPRHLATPMLHQAMPIPV